MFQVQPIYSHLYTGVSNCVFTAVLSVTNPCGLTLGPLNWTIDIHGRDILTDGDGDLDISAQAPYVVNATKIIEVCEGSSHNITLVDNSKWNCQNPVDYLGNTRPPNNTFRTIQWIYGEDNIGTVINTIGTTLYPGTGDPVVIGGTHDATLLGGYMGPTVNTRLLGS